MSSDNGIYVLKTRHPADKDKFEYRVIHATAIETVHYNRETGEYQEDFIPETAFLYFEGAPVFTSEAGAHAHAHNLLEKIDFTEYGICHLEHPNQIFPFFLQEELDDWERCMSKLEAERAVAKKEKLEKQREAATIHPTIEEIASFEVGIVYGYLTRDGKRIHGQLQGVEQIFLTPGTTFLPSDWAKEEK